MLSSHQVFAKFIKNDSFGLKTGEDILSAECFKLWVKTRVKPPMHPEQSYKRIVVAHIRGKDGRKAFSEDVENSLLLLLRHSNENPWSRCFGNDSKHVGERGFKQLGFHEAKKLKNSQIVEVKRTNTEPPLSSDYSDITIVDENNIFNVESDEANHSSDIISNIPESDSFEGTEEFDLNALFQEAKNNMLERHSKRKVQQSHRQNEVTFENRLSPLLDNVERSFKQRKRLSTSKLVETGKEAQFFDIFHHSGNLSQATVDSRVPNALEQIKNTINVRFTFDEIKKIYDVALDHGIDIFSPSLLYFWSLCKPNDPNLSSFYLMPRKDECKFRAELPIGYYIAYDKTWMVKSADDNCKKLLRRDVAEEHALVLMESMLEMMVCWKYMFPVQKQTGSSWSRLRYKRGDGTIGVFLINVNKIEDSLCKIGVQDVSDQFASLLSVPMFA